MTRNLVYILLLVAIAGVAFYLVRYRAGGTIGTGSKNFSITDTASVEKITVADMRGKRVDLARTPHGWTMNNRYPARKDAVDLMLATLHNMAVRYPVPGTARENVIKEMSANNRKVDVYDRNGKLMRSIYIGASPLDAVGNFMLLDGASDPMVVEVPSFHGTLETRFITDTIDMRSRNLIAVSFADLRAFALRYTDKPDSSFAFDFSRSDSFQVFNPVTNFKLPRSAVDQTRLFDYVSQLKEVNCEAFENYNQHKDSILRQTPFCNIAVSLRNGTQRTIACYRKPVDRRTKAQSNAQGQPLVYDLDRFYGLLDSGDFVLLQYFHFDRLFRNLDYFRKR